MLAASKNEKVNSKVAQLKNLLHKKMIKKKYNLDWVFNETNHINGQVEYTNYLHLHHSEWIGCTALHFAAKDGNLDAFDALLDYKADFLIKNNNNRTALHEIMQDKGSSVLQEYILDDAFVSSVLSAHLKYRNYENPCNNNGLSHFHIACAANNVEVVEQFLHSGVVIDHAVKADCSLFPGFTPLHFAAKYCAYEVAQVLLSAGANVHSKDAKGMVPLCTALEQKLKIVSDAQSDEPLKHKNEELLVLLLEKEITYGTMVINSWGLTFLHVACTLENLSMAEDLSINVVNINHTVSVDSPLWAGYSALHFAALCNLDAVMLLMDHGADINAKDAKGVTPLDICTERYKIEDIYDILSLKTVYKNIEILFDETKLTDLVFAMRSLDQFSMFFTKLDKNFCIFNSPLWPGCSPMHLAVLFSKKMSKSRKSDDKDVNLQILKKLCKHSRMFHIQDIHGRSPLHLAFRLDKKPALDLLLNYFESHLLFNLIDEDGLSYLHIACAKNRKNLLKKLLAMGTNVNSVYRGESLTSPTVYSGSTALHLAVINGSTEAVEVLVKHGSNLYAKDGNGMTPIHLVLSNVHKKLADMMLEMPNLRDSVVSGIGLSHLHIACLRGKTKVVRRLLDNGADMNGLIVYSKTANERSSDELSFLEEYTGYSPLLFALQDNRSTIAKLLLERGADAFIKNAEGMPIIYKTFVGNFNDSFDTFVEFAKTNNALKARLATDIGMTELHVACLDLDDIDTIEQLMEEGADINAQIFADSPIFQGYTPLYIVMHVACDYKDEIVDRMIRILIEAGADVTLQDAKSGKTVIHLAWQLSCPECGQAGDPKYVRVNTLLRAQRDFSVNPVSVEGLSHFHVACGVCNVGIVEKFLSHGNVDVDRPTNYYHQCFAGDTALHFAVVSASKFDPVSDQLAVVDLLLEHRADFCAENMFGKTPIHEAVLLKSFDVFERLVRSGADVNAKDSCGNTPLSTFLSLPDVPAEKIRFLLKAGCCLNYLNPITDVGHLGTAVCKLSYSDLGNLICAIIVNFKEEMKIDELGRTVLHNIVSADSSVSIFTDEYVELIEKLSTGINCDVDDQDNLGRTALHMAVRFCNYRAIRGLLMVGADVNIADVNGQRASDYFVDSCSLCDEHNNERADEPWCVHLKTLEALTTHVKKLQLCGLDVNEKIGQFASKAFEKFGNAWTDDFIEELEIAKNTVIGSYSLTLHEFLSENEVVVRYPTMSKMKRNDINEFFSVSEVKSVRAKFPELAEILRLQYRKARARSQLLESAKDAMEILIGFRMPEICFDFIFIPLKNSELENLILSATGEQIL